ncbi:helix-turn-helix transcriptional regulator [Streptomyces zhihengii]|uniref:Helix-turn-helix transcriptional regulator n=1 Tax=Streptomyces zhihengii TaxID=1818004 RepID=A0ABS2UJI3_9ACTN|nr:AraC family transcriptional regulator [Streptomyces zhihengii]MBM9617599.1 helix-turn-helix transcriptional regulator [Streptomyces zhihengii]
MSATDSAQGHGPLRVRAAGEQAVVESLHRLYGLTCRLTLDGVGRSPVVEAVRSAAAGLCADEMSVPCRFGFEVDEFPLFAVTWMDSGHVETRSATLAAAAGPGQAWAPCDPGAGYRGRLDAVAARTVSLPVDLLRAAAGFPAGDETALRLGSLMPPTAALHERWGAMVRYAGDVVRDGPVAPLVADTVARLVAVTALDVFPSNFTRPGPGSRDPGRVGPAGVRRAVEHIREHAGRPLSLADIAHVAGVTGRALQYGFARHLDTSPMAFLRRVRLERAHAQLLAGERGDGTTVAAVASRWGWTNPSHFTAAYRRAYGVAPSRTLHDGAVPGPRR